MNKLKIVKHELYFAKETGKNKLNMRDLSWENVFKYFFSNERTLLFLTDDDDKLEGILTLGDFIKYGRNLRKAVNTNYYFVYYGDEGEMCANALRIYNEHGIQSDVPVVDSFGRIAGYITDRKFFSDRKSLTQKKLKKFLAWIERIKKSCFLSKEIKAFQKILKGADIYVYPCNAYSQVISALGIDLETVFLSERDYIKMINDLSESKGYLMDKDKLRLIFDFGTGNRHLLYRAIGVLSIYDLNGFVAEFTKFVENEMFSRILRITQDSAYTLKDYIKDNEIENISFASNRLLTNYIYRYIKENEIPISLQHALPVASIVGSRKINGVRISLTNLPFYQCDTIGQQLKLNQDFLGKKVTVFYIMCAVHAKVTNSEKERMKEQIYIKGLIEKMDEKSIEALFGNCGKELSPREYIKTIYASHPLAVRRRFENDIVVNCDISSPYINIENGIRRTCYQPKEYCNTIYIIGPCFALCQYVQDSDTIPSLLAKRLTEDGYAYRVINLGMLASFNAYELARLLYFKNGDIVIHLLGEPVTKKEMDILDTSSAFDAIPDREDMFLDWPSHCGKKGNEVYADVIYQRIKSSLKNHINAIWGKNNVYEIFKTNRRDLFVYEFDEYLDLLRRVKEKVPQDATVFGAIVMNCNPFTIGHQYLVEYALQHCDYLFVFVVQEERSYFKFEDRFAIAKSVCRKYGNVLVIPSGKMLASQVTIPEYFMREMVKDTENMDYELKMNGVTDHRIFASYIASELEIKKRFVGEEPLDSTTCQYNLDMKKVLPTFGIEVEEIPRKTLPSGEIISASKVRQMYRNGKFEQMCEMLPEYTYNYLVRVSSQYLKKEENRI